MKALLIILLLTSLWSVQSQTCLANCNTCTNSTACTQCANNFFLDQQRACRKCPEGCNNCEATQAGIICSDCLDDFQLANGQCFKCSLPCGSGCTLNPLNCDDCDLGFDLIDGPNGQKRCVPLQNCEPQNCGACANGVSTLCQTCMPGYFQFLGVCTKCKFPCTECQFPLDAIFTTSVNATMATLITQVQAVLTQANVAIDINSLIDRNNPTKLHKELMTLTVLFLEYVKNTYGITQQVIITQLVNNANSFLNINIDNIYPAGIQIIQDLTGQQVTQQQLIQLTTQIVIQKVACTKCAWKFGLTNTAKCQSCVEGCLACPGLVCIKCELGLSLGSNTCDACAGNCKTCADGDTSACTSCVAPYSLSSSTCILCEAPCKTCQSGNANYCLTCIMPFSVDAAANGTCFRCQQDICKKCLADNQDICLECRAGKTLVDGKCQSCPKNCLDCTTDACVVCQAGYFLADGKCESCRPGCSQCQSLELCSACIDGLFLNSQNQCKRCKQGCLTCANSEQCLQFNSGFAEFNGQVVSCKRGCSQCNPQAPEQCLVCSPRFYLDSNICKKCGENCETCNNANDCTQCIPNAHNAGDGTCNRCQGACRTCDSGNLTSCLTCKRGFVLNGTKCEKLCKKFCLDCDPQNVDVCLKASQGYTIKENGSLVKCLGGCSGSCDPRDITVCTSCIDGFQLVENQCVRCPKGCSKCRDGSCEQCYQGFHMSEEGDKIECKKNCKSPCTKCDGDKCEKCAPGFKISNSTCQLDLSCGSTCEFCPPGTYVSAEDANGKTCTQCSANCASCDNSQCFTCMDGFYENDGSCSPCNGNCLICNDLQSCKVCADGFFLPVIAQDDAGNKQYSDICEQCSSQCLTCVQNANQCDSCPQNRKAKSFTCFTRLVVKFLLEFDIQFEQFKENGVSQDIIDKMITILGVDATKIILDAISEGSSKVDGSTQASSEQEGASLAASLESGDYGFKVLSSSIGVFYDDQEISQQPQPNNQPQDKEPTPTEEEQKANIGLIVGLVVGGVVLIAIIGLLVYKLKFSKVSAETQEKSAQISENQTFDDLRKSKIKENNWV